MKKSLFKILQNPRRLGLAILHRYFLWLPDKPYLKLKYWLVMGKKLNLDNPRSFTEKIQWLKLYDRNPKYTIMVDKLAVKEYVASIIGKDYIIPTLAVWDSVDEIDLNQLPDKFVLKTTHGGGGKGVVICRDKSNFDFNEAKAILSASLKSNIYTYYREWPYKDVPRRIIAEQLLENSDEKDIRDYKLFNFDGKVKFLKVDFNRFIEHRANYYDPDWNFLNIEEDVVPSDTNIKIDKPNKLSEMITLAESLSKHIHFIRTDFYFVNNKIYFGEITFYPASGMEHFLPKGSDQEIGKLINLPIGGVLN